MMTWSVLCHNGAPDPLKGHKDRESILSEFSSKQHPICQVPYAEGKEPHRVVRLMLDPVLGPSPGRSPLRVLGPSPVSGGSAFNSKAGAAAAPSTLIPWELRL